MDRSDSWVRTLFYELTKTNRWYGLLWIRNYDALVRKFVITHIVVRLIIIYSKYIDVHSFL